jgi:importin-5
MDVYTDNMTPITVSSVRTRLMDTWSKEESSVILRRLNHILAQSASRGDWNEFLPFMIASSVKMPPVYVISALEIIEIISEYSPDQIFANITMLGNFLGGLFSSTDQKIAFACAKATAACVVSIDDESARNSFKPALSPIISVLGNSLNGGNESDASSIIEHLVSIAQSQPLFFKGTIDSLVTTMLSIAGSTSLEFSSRSIALELVVTLTESAPALARRSAPLLDMFAKVAMTMMLEIETDDSEWLQMKYGEESQDDCYFIAEEAIERVSAGLGGKIFIPIVTPLVESFAQNSDWRYRRAAIAALTRLAEGSSKHFEAHLPSIFDFLLII